MSSIGKCRLQGRRNRGMAADGWISWWRQMETFSALLALGAGNSAIAGEFPSQRPVTRSFEVFFDLRLNQRVIKQWWGWWFETLSCPLWCPCNVRGWIVQKKSRSVRTSTRQIIHLGHKPMAKCKHIHQRHYPALAVGWPAYPWLMRIPLPINRFKPFLLMRSCIMTTHMARTNLRHDLTIKSHT